MMMKKLYAGLAAVLMMSILVMPGCAKVKEALTGESASQEVQPSPRYLDFSDILIPGELRKVPKESYIINGHGRLVLSGRLYAESLGQFFITSMNTDGWAMMNQYKYQGSIKIFFKKSERFSSILINENPLGTWVEIWVVPQEKI
jgi:hypothetical protein